MPRRSTVFLFLALLLPGCAAPPPAPETARTPVQERMFLHFALARDLRIFAVTGDLERLSVTAEELARADDAEALPPGSEEYVDRIRGAAVRASEAEDLDAATFAVAELAATCGSCHERFEVPLGERFVTAAPYLGDPEIRHQNYLSWVSRLLWDGLVGPSDRTWTTGAGALVDPDSYPPPRAGHVPASVNAEAARTLDEIGVQAVTSDDTRTRTDLLARVWATCADCHVQAGVR